jgi:ABC-type Fe3+-hydroxamate transport system substrate-binding protein
MNKFSQEVYMKSLFNYLIVISICLIFFMSACVPIQSTTPKTVILEPEIETEESVIDPMANTKLMFTDATGKSVSLPDFPQRIIVAGRATPYVLDTLYLFPEAAKKLVALEVRGFDTQAFLELVDPTVQVKKLLHIILIL